LVSVILGEVLLTAKEARARYVALRSAMLLMLSAIVLFMIAVTVLLVSSLW